MASTPSELQRTPLYGEHLRLSAKLVAFGGWEMPVYYTSILDEHQSARQRAGIFDISHMGEVEISGPKATEWLNSVLTNNLERLAIGEGQYTLMLNDGGGVIDDLIVYRRSETGYFLVVNAAKIGEDVSWLQDHQIEGVSVSDQSQLFAAVAVQGPNAAKVFQTIGELPPRNHIGKFKLGRAPMLVARTGYTGEDGFEGFFPAETAPEVWSAFLELGKAEGLTPCGLGARDTLRLEACYPLNGSDLSPDTTPLEAGLGFFVDLKKTSFIGQESLLRQAEAGLTRRLVAVKLAPKSPPPRPHYTISVESEIIGELTSGTQSPTLGVGIGLGYLKIQFTKPGQTIEVDVRGRKFPATVEKKPLYKRNVSA
ncbi:MAG: glycine cleavage system aminomethyltransferase GcvT [Verrucomicrobia bacterium]|nr:glycine cleavage system aminomethyltransferase GcvT [Verrucomicrobiota bacterium]